MTERDSLVLNIELTLISIIQGVALYFLVLDWFALNTVYAALIWLFFIWDLRLIRRRAEEDRSPAGQQLYAVVEEDQLRNIRILLPAALTFALGATLLIHYFPGFFLERGGYWYPALLQLAASLAYLAHSLRFYERLKPLQVKAIA